MYSDGTMEAQHQRTIELIIHILETGDCTLHGILYFLHDTQSTLPGLKRLAEIAHENGRWVNVGIAKETE